MKPPTTPFWAYTDIGSGLKWHLCVIRGDAEEPMIYFVQDDFEDYWYGDDWDKESIKLIRPPKAEVYAHH